jgi:hypothetical protein
LLTTPCIPYSQQVVSRLSTYCQTVVSLSNPRLDPFEVAARLGGLVCPYLIAEAPSIGDDLTNGTSWLSCGREGRIHPVTARCKDRIAIVKDDHPHGDPSDEMKSPVTIPLSRFSRPLDKAHKEGTISESPLIRLTHLRADEIRQ